MLSSDIVQLVNSQFNKEVYSAYFYLDMANYYAAQGLAGFNHWFTRQAAEEMEHAMRFRDYMVACNAPMELEPVLAPPKGYQNIAEPLHLTLAHEKQVTAWIVEIHKAALAEQDYRTLQMLEWFLREQEEEEESAASLLAEFAACKNNPANISHMDANLAKRGIPPVNT